MSRINKEKNSKEENSLKWVEVTRVRDADIEDLFDAGVYLDLVNKAYKGELPDPLTMKMITGSNPRIVERLIDYFERENISNGLFDRYVPAAFLLENFDSFRGQISDDTVSKIETLINRINSLLPGALKKTAVNGKVNGRTEIDPMTNSVSIGVS